MRKYWGVLHFNNGTKLPFVVNANDNADGLVKVLKYCQKEGYFPNGIEIKEIYDNIGIIEI